MDPLAPQPQTTVLMGYAPMDTVHAEFDQLVGAALASPDDGLHAALQRVREHLVSHFGQEDAWMRDNGFPAADCHIDEHAAVMRSADEVLPLVEQGRFDVGRSFLAE